MLQSTRAVRIIETSLGGYQVFRVVASGFRLV